MPLVKEALFKRPIKVDILQDKADPALDSIKNAANSIAGLADETKKYVKPAAFGVGAGAIILGSGKLYRDLQRAKKEKLQQDYTQYLLNRAKASDERLKTAAFKFNPKNWSPETKKILKNTAVATGTGLAAKGLVDGADYLQRRFNRGNKDFKKFLAKYPEYDNGDPRVREHYDVLRELNPMASRHPLLIKSFMKESYDIGDGGYISSNLQVTESKMGEIENKRKLNDPAKALAGHIDKVYNNYKDYQDSALKRQEELLNQKRIQNIKNHAAIDNLATEHKYKNPVTNEVHQGYHPHIAKAIAVSDDFDTRRLDDLMSPDALADLLEDKDPLATANPNVIKKVREAGFLNDEQFDSAKRNFKSVTGYDYPF